MRRTRLAQCAAPWRALCPLTEGSLGDGIFNGEMFLQAQGRFGIGTDSNIQIDAPGGTAPTRIFAAAETSRPQCHDDDRRSVHRPLALCDAALQGGTQALGPQDRRLAPGHRADIVVLDADHPDLSGVRGDDMILDVYIFSAGRALIDRTIVGGVDVVK